jgi:phospholipid/cholesterol/gamma-HCH transport system ATP-binding protein
MVTHDLDSLWQVTDRIAVLADKQVITVQAIEELVQFEHEWVQMYFHGERGAKFIKKPLI